MRRKDDYVVRSARHSGDSARSSSQISKEAAACSAGPAGVRYSLTLLTKRPFRKPPLIVLAVLLLAASVGAGLAITHALSEDSTNSGAGAAQPFVSQKTLNTAVAGLCQAQLAIAQGNLAGARTPFLNKSHLFLHSLAAGTESKDRELTANLLVAMYTVEDLLALPTGLGTAPTPVAKATPAESMASLLVLVGQAAAVQGLSAANC